MNMQRPDIEKLKSVSIDEMGRIGAEQYIKELIDYIELLEYVNKQSQYALRDIYNKTAPDSVITKEKLLQIHYAAEGALENA